MITNKKAQNWKTPRPLFNRLHAEYAFTVDAAASISNHLLPRYWTQAHDAFKQDWLCERSFWNPPFSSVARWLTHAIEQRDRGAFSVGLVMGSIETAWFHDLATRCDKHLFRRRVAYEAPPGIDKSTPSFPSILLVLDPEKAWIETIDGVRFSAVRDGVTGEYVRRSTSTLR